MYTWPQYHRRNAIQSSNGIFTFRWMCCARPYSKLRDQIHFFRFGNNIDCEVLNLAIQLMCMYIVYSDGHSKGRYAWPRHPWLAPYTQVQSFWLDNMIFQQLVVLTLIWESFILMYFPESRWRAGLELETRFIGRRLARLLGLLGKSIISSEDHLWFILCDLENLLFIFRLNIVNI